MNHKGVHKGLELKELNMMDWSAAEWETFAKTVVGFGSFIALFVIAAAMAEWPTQPYQPKDSKKSKKSK